MKNSLFLFALVGLLSTASANYEPTVPTPATEQKCTCETAQATINAQVLTAPEQLDLQVVEVTTDQQHVAQAGFGFFASECCGGGGWGSTAMKSPLLYLSLAFIALLYVNRRSLFRAMRRHQLRTA
jgi:hypothetical protein